MSTVIENQKKKKKGSKVKKGKAFQARKHVQENKQDIRENLGKFGVER